MKSTYVSILISDNIKFNINVKSITFLIVVTVYMIICAITIVTLEIGNTYIQFDITY